MNRIAPLLLLALALPAQAQTDWPSVVKVEAQPLLAQARRVAQALDFLGQPLPPAARKSLDDLQVGDGDEKIAAAQGRAGDS